MGKIDYLSILLQKPTPIFFPGESVIGVLNIRTRERLKINNVMVSLKGEARTSWTETRSNGKSTTTVRYSMQEEYFNTGLTLMIKQPNADLFLEVGDVSLPFHFVLPLNIPTSFEHKTGRIRYQLNANISIPWSFDKSSYRSFTVISNVDLNLYPMLRQPQSANDTKTLGFGPFKSDPIIGTIHLPKTGYVPGEQINFSVTLENNSKREIKDMTVSLIQFLDFQGKHIISTKTKHEKRILSTVKFPTKIAEKTTEKWNSSMLIPSTVSSLNNLCNIIRINYVVILNINPAGLAISKDIPVPITIGTIPIGYNPNQHTQPYANTASASVASNYSSTASAPLAPPSYQECMLNNGTFENENAHEEKKSEVYEADHNYKPIYPYFNQF